MKKIGIDFGTTNTMLCFMNNDRIVPFPDNETPAEAYQPTVVAIKDGKPHWGRAAYEVDLESPPYQHFKMLLGEPDNVLYFRGFINIRPDFLIKTYLSELYKKYTLTQKVQVEKVVLTVPQVWMENKTKSLELMKRICEEAFHGIPFEFESEPLAACTYFCYKYSQEYKQEFDGHVAVIDFGGGTLDISLCSVKPGEGIKCLESFGTASGLIGGKSDIKTLGKAGVAFDDDLLKSVIQNIKQDSEDYVRLLQDIDNKKRRSELITEKLKHYVNSGFKVAYDDTVFKLHYNGEVAVRCSHMVKAFEKVSKESLESYLDQLFAVMKEKEIDYISQKHFKVVMVGGFTSFYLVEKIIKGKFESFDDKVDERFNTGFLSGDRAHAVAMGAAVLAEELVDFTKSVPFGAGIKLRSYKEDKNEDDGSKDIYILHKGDKIEKKGLKCYAAGNVYIGSGDIPLFIDYGVKALQAPIEMPQAYRYQIKKELVGKVVKVGFSIDQDLILRLEMKELKSGKEYSFELGDMSRAFQAIKNGKG